MKAHFILQNLKVSIDGAMMLKRKKNQPKGKPSIILVGMMGAGKTHIGQALAQKLGREFIDLDELIEQRAGIKIPDIFVAEGEHAFRLRETRLLAEICESTEKIVATGGGVVITPQNREILKSKKVLVIYLKVSPRTAFARTKGSDRPLLQTKNPLKTITKLIEQRAPWYEKVADVQFDSKSKNVVDKILDWIAANEK